MSLYLTVKLIHVVSSTILFGTGLGSAFYMWRTHRSGNISAIANVSRNVVLADWLFTTPAILIQPATGLWLATQAQWTLDQAWISTSIGLYLVAVACWLPVVWIQMRVRDLAADTVIRDEQLSPKYFKLMRIWFLLGWPAFASVAVIFYLMVAKPAA